MRVFVDCSAKLLILLGLGTISPWVHADQKSAILVQRKEDEFLLPPYLRQVEGGLLNINIDQTVDHRKKRAVKTGEWLEYGDSFAPSDRIAIYVQMNETLQWVGGGALRGHIGGGVWNTAKTAYELDIQRGWMKVWVKPGAFTQSLKLSTPHVSLLAKDAVYWLLTSKNKSELYVFSGEVTAGDYVCKKGDYCTWQVGEKNQPKISNLWTPKTLEDEMARRYSNLVRLSNQANEEWDNGKSSKAYEELRAKGWKKSDRFFPVRSTEK